MTTMPKYYVLKEFYIGGRDSIAALKHTIIELPAHRGEELVSGGLLREIADIPAQELRPSETKPIAPNANRKKK